MGHLQLHGGEGGGLLGRLCQIHRYLQPEIARSQLAEEQTLATEQRASISRAAIKEETLHSPNSAFGVEHGVMMIGSNAHDSSQ